jgi:hypothetical protein
MRPSGKPLPLPDDAAGRHPPAGAELNLRDTASFRENGAVLTHPNVGGTVRHRPKFSFGSSHCFYNLFIINNILASLSF